MDECSVMVVIHTDSNYALAAPSITHMTLLTEILLVSLFCNFIFAFSPKHVRHDNVKLFDRQSTGCEVRNYRMTHMTIVHASMELATVPGYPAAVRVWNLTGRLAAGF